MTSIKKKKKTTQPSSSITSDVAVFLGRLLVHLHRLDAVVVLRRQLLQDKVTVLVRPHKVSGRQLVRRDQTGHRKIDRLPKVESRRAWGGGG